MSHCKVQFASISPGDFSSVVKARVEAYFRNSKRSKQANFEMVAKSVLYLTAYFEVYVLTVFGGFSLLVTSILAVMLGLLTAGIGFNIGHDALHGAYARRKWINTLMSHSFSMMGAGVFNWRTMHNVVHHSYTNIAEADGDLHPMPWLRFSRALPWTNLHRFQHWYALGLYCFTSIVWVFVKDYMHIGRAKHLVYEKTPTPRREYLSLFLTKGAYYIAFLILPVAIMQFPWWQILIGFFLMHFAAGFSLAITFQLGHLVENTEFSQLSVEGSIPDTWSIHQLKSSSNFSVHGPWSSWLFGGLNFQIEHHLFPKICHVHYRHLSPIIKKTAAEFNLPYNAFPSFRSAVRSHLRYLKKTGASTSSSTDFTIESN